MKRVLRLFFISLFALWLAPKLVTGFSYSGGFQTLAWAAGIFTLINLFVRPFLRLFFLPLNILTLGLFSWAANVLVLYLLMLVVHEIKIVAYNFPGFSWQGFTIPSMYISFLFALIISSFVISFISSFLNWLAK